MQAPGFRMNEREPNPNPFIAFIRALKQKRDHNDAEMILKAVAAQMKKIMETRFHFVGTLEEAEFNRVFAGRNWNHGQSIELVLRGPSGRFLPLPYITSVMCHEMAHIEQMNHGPKFQKLMREIKADVARMQAAGHFGDGFWSDGRRLKDSVKMGAEGLKPSDFPEYVCGVTAGDAKKARGPRRGPGSSRTPGLVQGEASHRSGRQTEYRRKAGRRNLVDMGEGVGRLDGMREITKVDRDARKVYVDDQAEHLQRSGMSKTKARAIAAERWDEQNPWFKEGNTRGKVAKSKTAAELRAAAAEKRLLALAGPGPSTITSGSPPDLKDELSADEDELNELDDQGDEEDVEDPHIGIEERKREMEDEMDEEERDDLRGGWEEFVEGPKSNGGARKRPTDAASPDRKPKVSKPSPNPVADDKTWGSLSPAKRPPKIDAAKPGPKFNVNLIREERMRALGLATTTSTTSQRALGGASTRTLKGGQRSDGEAEEARDVYPRDNGLPGWKCCRCTFINLMDHGRCEMCQARPDGSVPTDVE